VKELRALAKANTPTGVISLKTQRPERRFPARRSVRASRSSLLSVTLQSTEESCPQQIRKRSVDCQGHASSLENEPCKQAGVQVASQQNAIPRLPFRARGGLGLTVLSSAQAHRPSERTGRARAHLSCTLGLTTANSPIIAASATYYAIS
jgi:hypothetical protein